MGKMKEVLLQNIETRARKTDPPTSHRAARRAKPRTGTIGARIIEYLDAHPEGAATHDISDGISVQLVSVSPLMCQLVNRGLVRIAGTKINSTTGAKANRHKSNETR